MWPLLDLHWGLVDRTLVVENVDPMSKVIPPIEGSDLQQKIKAAGNLSGVAGRGNTPRISGSGRINRIRAKGKVC